MRSYIEHNMYIQCMSQTIKHVHDLFIDMWPLCHVA